MDNTERAKRASEIGKQQKLRSSNRLAQIASMPLPPLDHHLIPEPNALDQFLSSVQTSLSKFWQAPFSIHKLWFYACGITWAFFVLELILREPFGGTLLSLFSLLPLWAVANLPDWLGFGISGDPIKNNKGKSV